MSDEDFGRRAERKAEKAGESLVDHPVRTLFKWLGIIIVVVIVLAIVGGVLGWIGGWFSGAAKTTGFDNTKAQHTALIGDYQSMKRVAENVCDAGETQTNAAGPTFLEDPVLALKAKYREIEADYDRRMENLFEARALIIKTGLPDVAPTLSEMEAKLC